MASILTELRRLISPELLSEVAHQTHESESTVATAYDAAIPACAAMTAQRSNDRGFMNQLVNLATGTAVDSDPIAAAMRLVSSPPGSDASTAAGSWLSTLFGQDRSGVTRSIARYAGIRESSATSLLMTCAPLMLGYLGRLIRTQNLTATSLAERLRGEQDEFVSALPAGFEMPGIVRTPAHAMVDDATRFREPSREEMRESFAFPLTALLAALAIGGLLWWGISSSRQPEVARMNVPRPAPSAVGTAGTIAPGPARAVPTPPSFRFPAGSFEDRIAKYLASPGTGSMTIDLDRVEFISGSSRLMPRSRAQIERLATIMRAYPNSTIVVAGHTDNRGRDAANLQLSQARAESVAKALTDDGVASGRIRAEGYGSQKPVADNSTARGRAQNRRVTLEVSR